MLLFSFSSVEDILSDDLNIENNMAALVAFIFEVLIHVDQSLFPFAFTSKCYRGS